MDSTNRSIMSATNPTLRGLTGSPDEDANPGAVLDALHDVDCRRILEAVSEEAMTALELADACDIPSSTMYRKVEKLREADLVEERIRISSSGKHATEYRKAFEDVTLTVPDDGDIRIEITESDSSVGTALSF